MSTRTRAGGVLVALLAAVVLVAAAPAWSHNADPHYLTRVDAIAPATPGVKVVVINRSDRLDLINASGKDVLIRGYQDEPYARVLADGTVQQNTRSPATYLNEDRYGKVAVPKLANAKAEPVWKTLDKTGHFVWHDHRMHWMSTTRPAKVKDPDARQEIFTWKVPLTIGTRAGDIDGTLFWTPLPGAKVSSTEIGVGGVIVVALCGGLLLVHRRRMRGTAGEPGEAKAEAW